MLENIPGQVEWDSAQPDVVKNVPAHCRGDWTRLPLKVSSKLKYSISL